MSRLTPPQAFAVWLEQTGMTGTEKQDSLRLVRQGFAQGADLLLLGVPGQVNETLARALGGGRFRRGKPQRLGSWQLWSSPKGPEAERVLARFLAESGPHPRKKLIVLLAQPGRGGRLRARSVWRRTCRQAQGALAQVPVLVVQAGGTGPERRFHRQEQGEWMLQQEAEDCLGRPVPVLTVSAQNGRERLWYQLAKSLQ